MHVIIILSPKRPISISVKDFCLKIRLKILIHILKIFSELYKRSRRINHILRAHFVTLFSFLIRERIKMEEFKDKSKQNKTGWPPKDKNSETLCHVVSINYNESCEVEKYATLICYIAAVTLCNNNEENYFKKLWVMYNFHE